MRAIAINLPTKMPRTFLELNQLRQLRPVADDADLDEATEMVDRLAVINKPTRDQADYLDTLTMLVEHYEAAHQPMDDIKKPSSLEVLKHLLVANEMKQADLAKLLGIGRSAVSMILSGQRPITADHARVLGRRFAVEAGLFL